MFKITNDGHLIIDVSDIVFPRIKVDVIKDQDGNLLMIPEHAVTDEQKRTLIDAARLFKGADFNGPGFNVYLQGDEIVLEYALKAPA